MKKKSSLWQDCVSVHLSKVIHLPLCSSSLTHICPDDADAGEKKSHKSVRRRQREAANNQKQEETQKRPWEAHRSSMSSHSSGDEVWTQRSLILHEGLFWGFFVGEIERALKVWIYVSHRERRRRLWPDWPLHPCWRVHTLRPHPWTWVRTLKVMETPRLGTPATLCQVKTQDFS